MSSLPPSSAERRPLELWLGPARSGKSTAALAEYCSSPSGWLIVPTEAHASALRIRARTLQANVDSNGIVTFATVIRALTGHQEDRSLRAATKRRVLADICERRLDSESYFARMRGIPGFVAALSDLIGELKLSDIAPQDLERAAALMADAETDTSLNRKAREIGALYANYESFGTQHGMQDDEGLAAAAAAAVRDSPTGAKSLIIVDGFLRLSRSWRMLLAALLHSGSRVIVSITYEEGRPALFSTSERTLTTLTREFSTRIRRFERPDHPAIPDAFRALEQNLFSNEDIRCLDDSESCPLYVLDAPNVYAETEMVMRELKRAHDSGEADWKEMQILIRTPGAYGPTLSGIAERFEVPLLIPQGPTLVEIPVVKALTAIIRVFANNWSRSDVLAFLRSGFSGCPRLESEMLLKHARTLAVRDGVENWRRLRDKAPPSAAACLDLLFEWSDRVAALRADPEVISSQFAVMVDAIGIRERAEDTDSQTALTRALRVAGSVSSLESRLGGKERDFQEWAATTIAAWSAETLAPTVIENAVLMTDAYDARVRDAKITAVMGLTEGAFPRKLNEDAFFRDDERALMAKSGLDHLEPRLGRSDDERLLFYACVSSCSARLYLSYPRTSLDGDNTPSFYLADVRRAVPGINTIRIAASDVVPSEDHCATDRDRLLYELSEIADRASSANSLVWRSALTAASEPASIEVREIVATACLPPLPTLHQKESREAYRGGKRLSVSELESLNRCPFQHFVRYRLKPEIPTDGAGIADRGLLYHGAITAAYRSGKKSKSRVDVDLLLRALDESIDRAPIDASVHRKGLLRRFLERALEGVASREEQYAEAFRTTPTYFELAFGMTEEESERRNYDPESKAEPLILRREDGADPVELCGAIDRVDLVGRSGAAMVLDYKTGKTPEYKQIAEGASLQMPIYLMALESLWDLKGAVACYDSAREPGRRRIFRKDLAPLKEFGYQAGVDGRGDTVQPLNEDEYESLKSTAREAVYRAIDRMAEFDIKPIPGDHCDFCEFGDICRTDRSFVHDGEPFDIFTESGALADKSD